MKYTVCKKHVLWDFLLRFLLLLRDSIGSEFNPIHPSFIFFRSFVQKEWSERSTERRRKMIIHRSLLWLWVSFLSLFFLSLPLLPFSPSSSFLSLITSTYTVVLLLLLYPFLRNTLCSITCHVPFPSHRFPRRKKMMKTLLNFLRRRIKEKKIILEFDKRY